jgi:hypothetical protein
LGFCQVNGYPGLLNVLVIVADNREIQLVLNILQGTEAKVNVLGGVGPVQVLAFKARSLGLEKEGVTRYDMLHDRFTCVNE